MPILKSEVALSPPDLFDLPDLPWRVAHVRSRQEKELARLLLRLNVPFYLPLAEKQVRRAGRRFVSFLPLFPGYLFFRGARGPLGLPAESGAPRWDDRLVSTLEVPDQPRLDAELRVLWRLQQSGAAFEDFPYLAPGDAVAVIDGPFQGLRGTVLREKGRTRLVVSVSFLRQSVAAEFEREALAPARPVRPAGPARTGGRGGPAGVPAGTERRFAARLRA
ncbi:MAG TPA: transcription termination/antitermination NusG family protein [Thermoanaerobaculia bacterium]|nr:transcription termination/antitermination NusG family protein [Thermoanaerobaculia bacterium]